MWNRRSRLGRDAIVAAAICVPVVHLRAQDCNETSVGLTPLNDLGASLYLETYEGGLYPGGINTPPAAHHAEGLARADAVEPLDVNGDPDPDGTYVLLSIGMSNTTQEFCSQGGNPPCDVWTFMGQALAHPDLNTTSLALVNGAKGGQAAQNWSVPNTQNYIRVRDQVLAPMGLTEAQVQAIWIKQASPSPQFSLPSPNADAFQLQQHLGNIVRACVVHYPNLKMIFFSSRIYAGYATTPLNPEPYAYETAFSVKWLIEAQIDQANGGGIDPLAGDLDLATTPWLGWSAYLWADGLIPRSDGLIWACTDLDGDGTHPAMPGEEKVGTLLLNEFLTSPYAQPWFTAGGVRPIFGDLDDDGDVDTADLLILLSLWGPCETCIADLDRDGDVDVADLLNLLAAWTAR